MANPVLELDVAVPGKRQNRNDHKLKIIGIDTFRAMQPRAYKTFKGKEWDEAAAHWDGLLDNHRSPVAHHPDLILEADHDTL